MGFSDGMISKRPCHQNLITLVMVGRFSFVFVVVVVVVAEC